MWLDGSNHGSTHRYQSCWTRYRRTSACPKKPILPRNLFTFPFVPPLPHQREHRHLPLGSAEPWLEPTDPDHSSEKTNTNDVRCVSWILSNITDPEALEAAIRLAGTIRWFEDGLNVEPPYILFVSTLKACFGPTGKVYPGLRDRAYHAAQAVLWIHTLALCKSAEFASRFSLPTIPHDTTFHDPDLQHLLQIYTGQHYPQHHSLDVPDQSKVYPHTFAMDLKHTFTPVLGQAGWSGYIPLNVIVQTKKRLEYHPSEYSAQPPPGILCLPWLACQRRDVENPRQDVCYLLSPPSSYSHYCLLVITLTRLYLNSPKQWLQPSTTPTLNVCSSMAC
jgi:hypothetical protein